MGACLVAVLASCTKAIAGAGQPTATVLAHAIIRVRMCNVTAGANPVGIRTGIECATCAAVAELHCISHCVNGCCEIALLASVSSSNVLLGNQLAAAMEMLGQAGELLIVHAMRIALALSVVVRMQLARGYQRQTMVLDNDCMVPALEAPYIQLLDCCISNILHILPLLLQIVQLRCAL